MKYTRLLGAMLLATLLITACGSATATEVPTVVQPLATEPAASASPVVVDTPEATGTSEGSVPVTGETTVKATLSDNYGPILTNGDEISLYIYTKDTQNGDTSACVDVECTSKWLPLTTEGAPVAGAGAIQSLLGTITRDDGTMQVTYNGWPLYLYSGDTAAGTVNGQGMDNEWTLVSPSGDAIQP